MPALTGDRSLKTDLPGVGLTLLRRHRAKYLKRQDSNRLTPETALGCSLRVPSAPGVTAAAGRKALQIATW